MSSPVRQSLTQISININYSDHKCYLLSKTDIHWNNHHSITYTFNDKHNVLQQEKSAFHHKMDGNDPMMFIERIVLEIVDRLV